MAKFFASCSKGLRDALEQEIKDIGIQRVWSQGIEMGVYFEGSWRDCYMVNLKSRIASRVLLPILDFPAYNREELYNNVMKHDYTKYINVDQGIYVDANVANSPKFRDQRFVAMVVKDAVVDQFREKYGERPDVDSRASLRLHLKMFKSQVSLAIDTSGYPLFQRGYREEKLEAPMKETLAAGLLQMTDWDGEQTIVDPMCGSGTFLIEAALKWQKVAPGIGRKKFAFQDLKTFQADVFSEVLEECMAEEREEDEDQEPIFFGFDRSAKAIKVAKSNARKAGVDHLIEFKQGDVINLENPIYGKGLIVTNPPYGERLSDPYDLQDLYKDFGHILKENFKGWTMWMISGNPDLPGHLRLKASRKFPVNNGGLDCRFLKYEIN
ncbi:MAG: methyltransferase domain-containing protein [Bdellovibrionota bacterium]|nr:RNA methyltransferase [Pseudobdellovibrionaceae bacterium]|tara:strand:- start:12731 stop:13873 length:1143 start_codon:yes stop_codon:yes gene_type:complete